MKTMVIGDTHGRVNSILSIAMNHPQINHIIHLGDMAKDAEDLIYALPNIKITAVDGNNERVPHFPMERFIEIGTKKAFITHGHLYGVKHSKDRLLQRAKELGAFFALFAHTHLKYEAQKDGVILLNPSNRGYILIGEDGTYDFFDL